VRKPRNAQSIRVFGLVQGVGFRPFLHRLASELGISGWAINTNDSVRIHAEGSVEAVVSFVNSIRTSAPPLAKVERVETQRAESGGHNSFEIRQSKSMSSAVTRVSPDMAVCDECLADIRRQPNRIDYPFVNCTNCGPRFSIIEDLPYDRPMTTMHEFTMCKSCGEEYENIEDRRYHAQPNACADCGPSYAFRAGSEVITDISSVLERTASTIDGGGIAAVKGVGGFHLACDATNERAVARLRTRKHREGKPLAVMCGDLVGVRDFALVSKAEEKLLTSGERPIVLLKALPGGGGKRLAPSVSKGMDTLGVMIPYMPFHYLLFERQKARALVLTSGNLSEEPIAIDDEEAVERLESVADAFITSNRRIHNRSDDSVLFVARDTPRFIRRSRGWAPNPIELPLTVEGIAACGAELKGSFCIGKEKDGILSQHLGDLKNPETWAFYTEAFERFCRLFRLTPRLGACDIHPDYLSTRFAEAMGVPVIKVQHHHAHIASCMAENGYLEETIGVSMDGTGLGNDGAIWGGEFLICTLGRFHRAAHLGYLPLPGGDAAVLEPWRMAFGMLYSLYGKSALDMDLPPVRGRSPADLALLAAAIDRKINSPLTSSAGRLFDGIAALTGLVTNAAFDAEAPMRLEAAIVNDSRSYGYTDGEEIGVLPIVEAVIGDLRAGVDIGVIAARFHNTFVDIIVDTVTALGKSTGIKTAALSGGVFQNRYVLEKSEELLESAGFKVLSHTKVPANDGGIALGQLAVAAAVAENGGE
jgi:hydrogenase maturation protein HypF